MAKKNGKTNPGGKPVIKQSQETVASEHSIPDIKLPSWLNNFKIQALIVIALSVALYINTIKNDYALDDYSLVVKNEYVLEGFAGIPDILTKDAFDSYYKQMNSNNQLSGGRYRPLSLVTYAIEQQFFGAFSKSKIDSVISQRITYDLKEPYEKKLLHNMHVRHLFNVFWFTLCALSLLYFLHFIVFKNNPVIALIATILFAIHPIHTEVVANVKSRDEILSLFFICLTFIFAFRYQEQKEKKGLLVAGLVSYFLAFLSKEYAIGLIILLPLAFYLFRKCSLSKSLFAALPYMGVMAVYIVIRLQIIAPMNEGANTNIQNNPYAFATDAEQLATKISTTLNYLKLLIIPTPLSSDYSYNSIPYKDFTNLLVWLSLAVHISLFWAFYYFLKRRHVISFAIAFYLVNLLLICNIIFNIGGTMGERLIFHSSVGFAIAVAYLLYRGAEKIQPAALGKIALAGCILLLTGLLGFKTITRNTDWKNDRTLFSKDLKVVPNSFLVNSMVATDLINRSEIEADTNKRKEDIHKGIELNNKAISINPDYVLGFMNKAIAYFKLGMADSFRINLDNVRTRVPNYPQLAEMYYNVGTIYFLNKQYAEASSAWQISIKIKPDYAPVVNGIKVLKQMNKL